MAPTFPKLPCPYCGMGIPINADVCTSCGMTLTAAQLRDAWERSVHSPTESRTSDGRSHD